MTFNNQKNLNAWTVPMFEKMFELLTQHGKDGNTKVLILTGSGPYYCAGANLSENIKLMHPKKLHNMIVTSNARIVNYFLDFPKLKITPEGCSSVHFERILGKDAANKMLEEGW